MSTVPIGQIAEVASKALDLAKTREERNNTDPMKANETARIKAEIADEATGAIAAEDLTEIRRQAAE